MDPRERRLQTLFLVAGLLFASFVPGGVAGASGYKVVHPFSRNDGAEPAAGLITDGSGNFYGTTFGNTQGGAGKTCPKGCQYGDVYKLGGGDAVSVLHAFQGGSDGAAPDSPVILSKGELYGTASQGGGGPCPGGCGAVFKISPDSGREKVLYSFTGANDGGFPIGGLLVDDKGNLFGTTVYGGADTSGDCFDSNGCGVVFKIAPDGTETALYSFCSRTKCKDGAQPTAALIADGNGNFYGTTQFGGANCHPGGCGTVFKLLPDGTETVLYSFCSLPHCTDGSQPLAPVIMDGESNLYGTTYAGGLKRYGQSGTVFKLAADGTETVLHAFKYKGGAEPVAGLVMDSAGNLYGTTTAGGFTRGPNCQDVFIPGCGTIFKVAPDGSEDTLYVFKGREDGRKPSAPLLLNGKVLLGTAQFGGKGYGVIFKVKK